MPFAIIYEERHNSGITPIPLHFSDKYVLFLPTLISIPT